VKCEGFTLITTLKGFNKPKTFITNFLSVLELEFCAYILFNSDCPVASITSRTCPLMVEVTKVKSLRGSLKEPLAAKYACWVAQRFSCAPRRNNHSLETLGVVNQDIDFYVPYSSLIVVYV